MTAVAEAPSTHLFKEDTRQVAGRTFNRYLIQTHRVYFGEDLAGVIERYAGDRLTPSSIVCLSQRVTAICTMAVRHASDIKEGRLAHFIVDHLGNNPDAGDWKRPKKMQVAIDMAGYPRILAAVVIGGFTRVVLKRTGDFWRIAGNHIAEIDGLNPDHPKPYNEYAVLPPPEPDKLCDDLAKRFGCGFSILDANNVGVKVVGVSRNLKNLGVDREMVRELMLDNPMSQKDQLTPILILEEAQLSRPAPAG